MSVECRLASDEARVEGSSENYFRLAPLAWNAFRRVRREPIDDAFHARLEIPRNREVEHARALRAAVLEVVHGPPGCEDEGAARRVDPAAVEQEAHRPLDDVEDVVLLVAVSAR